jgi:hypothetical protein
MEEYNRNFDELGEDLYKELVLQMTDLKVRKLRDLKRENSPYIL